MSSRRDDAQSAFLRAWSAIVNPFPGAAAAMPGAADWLRAAWRETGGGAPAFAEAYRRFGEWVGAALAGTRRGSEPAAALAAMARALDRQLEALLLRPAAADADVEARTPPASPWEQLTEALGGGRWPPEAVFAPTWFGFPGLSSWRHRWQDGMRAWLRQQAAAAVLQRRQLASLRDALDRFAARLLEERDHDETITSLEGLFRLWIECAEKAHEAALASAEYGREFGEFVNAGAALRHAVNDAAADFFAAFDVPTRRDFAAPDREARAPTAAGDETLADLESRLRDTLREMAELRATLAAAESRAGQAAGEPVARVPVKQTAVRTEAKKSAAAKRAVAAKPKRLPRAQSAAAEKPKVARAGEFDIGAIGARRG